MKALPLHQPFATLVSIGVKTIETRSWVINHRGGMQGLFNLSPEVEKQLR